MKKKILSVFPGHDEVFHRIDGEKYLFLAMVDSNNQRIINDQLIPEEEYWLFRNIYCLFIERFIYIQES